MRTALLAVALLAPLVAAAQGADPRADFTVAVQTPDGQPVPGATVLVGTDRGAAADADGQAVFEDVAPGRYAVRVSFVGRPTREVAAVLRPPGPWGLIVELADDANLLYDVVVEARSLEGTRLERDGFFDRLALGGGAVLTAEEISRRNPLDLADVLRGGVLGTRVQRGSTGQVAVSTRAAGACQMGVFLDGVYSPLLTDDLGALPAQGVVAVEVYRGAARIPLQYRQLGRTGSACGAVLVWTEVSTAAQ